MTEFVEIQGEPLAVHVFEPSRRRGDALLIHGFTGSKEDFAEMGAHLSLRGYRVVTCDNRGQHESPHSQREDAYTIASLARDAVALAGHFGLERPHLLGHSFGGLVALRATVLDPTRWSSLTMFCSGPSGFSEAPDLEEMLRVLPTMSMEEAWFTHRDRDAKQWSTYELLKRRWLMSDRRSVLTHAQELLSAPSLVDDVAALGKPAHVVYGEHDDAWPLAVQDRMASDLRAITSVISGASHCPNEDRPEYAAQVLADFWDHCSSSTVS